MSADALKKIPYLGIGIGLREEIADPTMRYKDAIDAVEIISEGFLGKPERQRNFLERFNNLFAVIPHGVKLSIASAPEIDKKFLANIKQLCEFVGATYYSDHFALTRLPGIDIGHLSPIWYTRESLDLIVKRIDMIQDFLGIPLVLENISAALILENADYEEPEFITQACHRTGCGLLMDVTNIHINSYNAGRDPYKWLERYPMDHVVQIHLAGGVITHELFHDTHSEEIRGHNEGVWGLLAWTAKQCDIKALIIERDQNFKEDFQEMILNDLSRARDIVERHRKI